MSDKIKLSVQKRKITGRKVKSLRREGIVPANIYGKDVKSQAIQVSARDFNQAFKQSGETGIIEIKIDKDAKTRPVLVNQIHYHPVTDQCLHVDFHQIDLTKKVSVNIPIELIGTAPAVSKGGVLLKLLNEIEVEALPADLPDKYELNISKLEEIGQAISLKDIKIDPKKVKFTTENLEELIVKIEAPTKEEEPVEAESEDAETTDEEGEAKEGDVEAKEGDDPKPEGSADKEKDAKEDKKPEAGQPKANKEGK
jgi:large subunit ribosomal protein L25